MSERIKHLATLVITVVFAIQSCTVGTFTACENDNIDESVRNEISVLDRQVVEALIANNTSLLATLLSNPLKKHMADEADKLTQQASKFITSRKFEVLDQYYFENSTSNIGNRVTSDINGLIDYTIHYQAANKEMFVSLIITESERDEFLITNIYGHYPDGWKLNIIRVGQITVNGMNAIELFEKAKKEYEKGYLMDATNNLFLSLKMLNPANDIWKYDKQDEVKELYHRVSADAGTAYHFPTTVTTVDSRPRVLNVYPLGVEEGYFPMVAYLTDIDLKDTERLRMENDQIHSVIGMIFKGLDKEKKYAFYKAFNEVPNGTTPVSTYGFVKENEFN